MTTTISLECVSGYFIHDEDDQRPLAAIRIRPSSLLDIYKVPPRFGLKDDSDRRWHKFLQEVSDLNRNSPTNTSYKFFLLSRHGQGYHNLAESKYGTEAWDNYWSKLTGDGEITWGPDPLLTPVGKDQALDIRTEWMKEAEAGLPPPNRRYCSPLSRALDTCDIMFDKIYNEHPAAVLVIENCREENGVHTCDKRNSLSYIRNYKPNFEIETGFTELDELWDANIRETKPDIARRARGVIERIFEDDPEATFISITAHGGFITGFQSAIGRKHLNVPTGGVFPVLVKAESLILDQF